MVDVDRFETTERAADVLRHHDRVGLRRTRDGLHVCEGRTSGCGVGADQIGLTPGVAEHDGTERLVDHRATVFVTTSGLGDEERRDERNEDRDDRRDPQATVAFERDGVVDRRSDGEDREDELTRDRPTETERLAGTGIEQLRAGHGLAHTGGGDRLHVEHVVDGQGHRRDAEHEPDDRGETAAAIAEGVLQQQVADEAERQRQHQVEATAEEALPRGGYGAGAELCEINGHRVPSPLGSRRCPAGGTRRASRGRRRSG